MITVEKTIKTFVVPDLCFYISFGSAYMVTKDVIVFASETGVCFISASSLSYNSTIERCVNSMKEGTIEEFEAVASKFIADFSAKFQFIKEAIVASEIAG